MLLLLMILQFGCIIHHWKINRKNTRENITETPMKMCASFFRQLNHSILVSIAIDWPLTALSECRCVYVCLWHPVCNMQPVFFFFVLSFVSISIALNPLDIIIHWVNVNASMCLTGNFKAHMYKCWSFKMFSTTNSILLMALSTDFSSVKKELQMQIKL